MITIYCNKCAAVTHLLHRLPTRFVLGCCMFTVPDELHFIHGENEILLPPGKSIRQLFRLSFKKKTWGCFFF